MPFATFTNCTFSATSTSATSTSGGWYGVGSITNCTATTASTSYITWADTGTGTTQGLTTWRQYDNEQAEQHRQERVLSAAERQANEEATRRWRADADQRAAAYQSAKERANQLLLEHLTPEQAETFSKNKWFIVEGGKSKQKYRIRDKGSLVANVDVLDGDKVAHRLCAHAPISDVPLHDNLLAQKTMLELDEEHFLRIANRHAA